MTAMYWATADVLALAGELAQGAVPTTATQLRANVGELFGAMDAKGAEIGLVPEDLKEARYAIVALLDEILVRANWPGRAEWQSAPLQLVQFQENTAGENFFVRADALCNQSHRLHVLQVYFLCLSLGFQGRYAMSPPGELEATHRRLATIVQGAAVSTEVLSPHGVPADAGETLLQRQAPILRLGLACLGAALVFYSLLLAVRAIQLSHALDPMRSFGGSPSDVAGKR
jgi:type VI secretion system protein ImpK